MIVRQWIDKNMPIGSEASGPLVRRMAIGEASMLLRSEASGPLVRRVGHWRGEQTISEASGPLMK